ncbi:MAG TPA: hypothetical protein VL400_02835 [Polyangiaceae bacterium]|nr:hypothetical protein [Polyangiaceae bacterium]
MNLGSAAIVIRPRTTAEVLDLGCRVTLSLALPLYLRIAALVLVPAYAALLCLHYLLDFTWVETWCFAFPLAVWLEGPFTVAASRLLFADRITARGTVRLFFARFWPYTMALIVDAIAAMFIIPWPTGTYVTEATLLEQASFTDARSRSSALVRGRSVAPALLGFMAMRASLVIVAELLFQAIVRDVFQLGEPFGTLWDDSGSPYALLGLLVAAPLVGTTRFLHYLDTRTRSDGWDIQVKFMSLVAREESARRPSVEHERADVRGRAA